MDLQAWAEEDRETYEELVAEALAQPHPELKARALAQAEEWKHARSDESPLPECHQPYPALGGLYRGFWRLQGDRHTALGGMGGALIGALSYVATSRWLHDHGYRPASEAWLVAEDLLYALDAEYLRMMHERISKGDSKEDRPSSDAAGAGG